MGSREKCFPVSQHWSRIKQLSFLGSVGNLQEFYVVTPAVVIRLLATSILIAGAYWWHFMLLTTASYFMGADTHPTKAFLSWTMKLDGLSTNFHLVAWKFVLCTGSIRDQIISCLTLHDTLDRSTVLLRVQLHSSCAGLSENVPIASKSISAV